MSRREGSLACVGVLVAAALCGCESVDLSEFNVETAKDRVAVESEAARRRSEFQETNSAESLRWLLGHSVAQGMSLDEVNESLGQRGERVYEDQWLKKGNTHVWREDDTYRWGPDDKGQVVYLFFREGHLVNFSQKDYR